MMVFRSVGYLLADATIFDERPFRQPLIPRNAVVRVVGE